MYLSSFNLAQGNVIADPSFDAVATHPAFSFKTLRPVDFCAFCWLARIYFSGAMLFPEINRKTCNYYTLTALPLTVNHRILKIFLS